MASVIPRTRPWRNLSGRDTSSAGDVGDVAQEVFRRLARFHQAELAESPQAHLIETAANVAAERSSSSRSAASLAENGFAEGESITNRLAPEEEIAKALLTLRPRQLEMLNCNS